MTEENKEEPLVLAIENVLAAAIVDNPDEEIFISREAINKDLAGHQIVIEYDVDRDGYLLTVEAV